MDDRSSVVIDVSLDNPGPRAARIRRAAVSFLAGERVLAARGFGRAFFDDPVYVRPVRIEPDRHVVWKAVCLDRVPEGADALLLRVVHGRSARRGSSAVVRVPLEPTVEALDLRLPFSGTWRVTQGHGCSTGHRVGGRGGDFAWDFAAVGAGGRLVRPGGEAAGRNEDSYSFGRPILAPVAGRVVRAVDGEPDNEELDRYPRRSMVDELERPEWIFGNFVVIDAGAGRFVLLGHLKRGSIRVGEGDRVVAGDAVARCGNSGNTIESHVHVQVMDRASAADAGVEGLPGVFLDYAEIVATPGGTPAVRRVQRGDPVDGALVAPATRERSRAAVTAPAGR